MTPRQIEALAAAFEKGNPYEIIPGARSNAGGATARMIDDLRDAGYLDRRREHRNEITVKGLEALAEHYRKKIRRAGPLNLETSSKIDLAEVTAAIPRRRAIEEEAAKVKAEDQAERRRQSDERVARSRERKIVGFRALFGEMLFDEALPEAQREATKHILVLDNDQIMAFVDRIVEKDQAL